MFANQFIMPETEIVAAKISKDTIFVRCRKYKKRLYHEYGNCDGTLKNKSISRQAHCDCVHYTKVIVDDSTVRV